MGDENAPKLKFRFYKIGRIQDFQQFWLYLGNIWVTVKVFKINLVLFFPKIGFSQFFQLISSFQEVWSTSKNVCQKGEFHLFREKLRKNLKPLRDVADYVQWFSTTRSLSMMDGTEIIFGRNDQRTMLQNL